MSYKVKGKISDISEVKVFDTGAKSLKYRIDTGDQYNPIWEFEIYKGADYADHVDNFVKYNKVGDEVEVDFNIRTREWEGKIFTNLSSWKVEKIGGQSVSSSDDKTLIDELQSQDSDLPF